MKTRLKKVQPERKKGNFQRKCSSIIHKENNSRIFSLKTQKNISKELLQKMLDEKVLNDLRGSVCLNCVDKMTNFPSKLKNKNFFQRTSMTPQLLKPPQIARNQTKI